jgi:hypothetical protein
MEGCKMTDLERLLMQQLLACEADLRNAEAVHAKNSARMSEVMQNALARAERSEKALADLKGVVVATSEHELAGQDAAATLPAHSIAMRIFEQVDM